jgi:hypothetical protein
MSSEWAQHIVHAHATVDQRVFLFLHPTCQNYGPNLDIYLYEREGENDPSVLPRVVKKTCAIWYASSSLSHPSPCLSRCVSSQDCLPPELWPLAPTAHRWTPLSPEWLYPTATKSCSLLVSSQWASLLSERLSPHQAPMPPHAHAVQLSAHAEIHRARPFPCPCGVKSIHHHQGSLLMSRSCSLLALLCSLIYLGFHLVFMILVDSLQC